jgi:hypothetical protein
MIGHGLLDQLIEILTFQPRGCGNQSANGAHVVLDPAQSRTLVVLDHHRYLVTGTNPQMATHRGWQRELPFARDGGHVFPHRFQLPTSVPMQGHLTDSLRIEAGIL